MVDGSSPDASSDEDLIEAGAVDDDVEAERVMQAVRNRLFGAEPARLGRFMVLKRLGEGASGIVYAGYDPELDRKVAIKVLRGEATHDRSRHEAKAMGRLRHPNVVAVHDLGTEGERLFVAMEYVEGTTVRAWLETQPGWQDVVEVFLQAGRGLAAAHEAELVHCDFKPANVLLTDEGDVRVADFGLARLRDRTSPDAEALESGELMRTGTITGTPAYMAPEVFEGEVPTRHSDQFSYCAALFEALYGCRPFAGDDVETLSAAVRAGEVVEPPGGTRVPGAVRRVITQGLARLPEERHGSMNALLDALEVARRSRRKLVAMGAGLVAVAALSALGFAGAARPPLCEGSEVELAEVWGPSHKQAVRDAFTNASVPYADDAYDAVARQLDAFANQWVMTRRSACEATRVHGTQSERALDLRMACLDRRRSQLQSLTQVLADADPAVVENAVAAVEALVPVSACDDVAMLEAGRLVPEDPTLRREVEAMRRELDGVVQTGVAGRTTEAAKRARALAARADELGFGPLQAEVQLALGKLQEDEGTLDDAEASLERAFTLGMAHGHDEVTARAAIHATDLVGKRKHEPEAGERWAWLAKPAVRRMGSSPAMEGLRLMTQSNVHWAEGAIDEARKGYEQALALLLKAHGERSLRVAAVRANLGASCRRLGDFEQALRQLTEAESIMKETVGVQHPMMSQLLNSIGNLHWSTKDYERSVSYHRRALDLKQQLLRPKHPSLGHSHNNLADALIELGHHEEAAQHYRMALDNWEEALGDAHPLLAYPLRGLGRVSVETGAPEGAIEPLERAFDLVMARDNSEVYRAETAWLLARALAGRDDARARVLAEDALARLEKADEPRGELIRDVKAWLAAHSTPAAAPSGS